MRCGREDDRTLARARSSRARGATRAMGTRASPRKRASENDREARADAEDARKARAGDGTIERAIEVDGPGGDARGGEVTARAADERRRWREVVNTDDADARGASGGEEDGDGDDDGDDDGDGERDGEGDDDDDGEGDGNGDESRRASAKRRRPVPPRARAPPLTPSDIAALNKAGKRLVLARWGARVRGLKRRLSALSEQYPTSSFLLLFTKPVLTECRRTGVWCAL